jgi:hypothetical protein
MSAIKPVRPNLDAGSTSTEGSRNTYAPGQRLASSALQAQFSADSLLTFLARKPWGWGPGVRFP